MNKKHVAQVFDGSNNKNCIWYNKKLIKFIELCIIAGYVLFFLINVISLFFFNILFLYFLAALCVSCGTQDLSLWHVGFSLVWRTSSVVVAHGLSCHVACGILVPRPGIEPASPALEGGFFTTGPPGKSLVKLILMKIFKIFFVTHTTPQFE